MLLGNGVTDSWTGITRQLSSLFDIGFCGLVVNATVFAIVSRFTKSLPTEHVANFAREADPR